MSTYSRQSATIIGANSSFDSGKIGSNNSVTSLYVQAGAPSLGGGGALTCYLNNSAGSGALTLVGNAADGVAISAAINGSVGIAATGTGNFSASTAAGQLQLISATGGVVISATASNNVLVDAAGIIGLGTQSSSYAGTIRIGAGALGTQGIDISSGLGGISIATSNGGNLILDTVSTGYVSVTSATTTLIDATSQLNLGNSASSVVIGANPITSLTGASVITIGYGSTQVNIPGSLNVSGNFSAGMTTTVNTSTIDIAQSAVFVNAVPLGINDSGIFVNRYPSDVVANPPVTGDFYGTITCLTTALTTSGGAKTSLTVRPLVSPIPNGSTIMLSTGSVVAPNFQILTTASLASSGSTSIAVSSFTPNFNYQAYLSNVTLQNTALAAAFASTSIALTSITLSSIPASGYLSGQILTISSGLSTQQITLTAAYASSGSLTAVSVTSFIPNFLYPSGSIISQSCLSTYLNSVSNLALTTASGVSAGTTMLVIGAIYAPGIAANSYLQLTYGSVSQTIQVGATSYVATGATPNTITVVSFTPIMNFPIGSILSFGSATSLSLITPQLATLTSYISGAGGSLTVPFLSAPIAAGSTIQLTAGATTQLLTTNTLTAASPSSPTTISLSGTFTPTISYPVGTTVTVANTTLTVASGTSAITSLSVNALASALVLGTQLLLTFGTSTQIVTLATAALVSATSVIVSSFTPTINFPIGTLAQVLTNNVAFLGSNLNILGWIIAVDPSSTANAESFQVTNYNASTGMATISGVWNNIHQPGSQYTLYPGTYAGVFWKEGSNEFQIGTNAVGVSSLAGFNSTNSPTFLYAGLAAGDITANGNLIVTGTSTVSGVTTFNSPVTFNALATVDDGLVVGNSTYFLQTPETISPADGSTTAHVNTATNLTWIAGSASPTANISGTLNYTNATIPDGFEKKILMRTWGPNPAFGSPTTYVYNLYINDKIVDAFGNSSIQQDSYLTSATVSSAVTSLSIYPLSPYEIGFASGVTLWLTSPNLATMQSWVTSAPITAGLAGNGQTPGVTTISVNSQNPSYAGGFPIGTTVSIQLALLNTAISAGSNPSSITIGPITLSATLPIGTTLILSSTSVIGQFQTLTLAQPLSTNASPQNINIASGFIASGTYSTTSFISLLGSKRIEFMSAGQSVHLIWNSVIKAWYIVGTGSQMT